MQGHGLPCLVILPSKGYAGLWIALFHNSSKQDIVNGFVAVIALISAVETLGYADCHALLVCLQCRGYLPDSIIVHLEHCCYCLWSIVQ